MTEVTRPGSRSTSLHRWTIALVVILTVLATITLIAQLYHVAAYFGDVVALYFAAWTLQFLFTPVVDWLCRHRLSRGAATGIVYLGALVLALGFLFWWVPPLVLQLRTFAQWLNNLSHQSIPAQAAQLERFIAVHAPASIRGPLIEAVQNISPQLEAQSKGLSHNALATVQTLNARIVPQTFSLITSGGTVLFQLLTALILAFFMTLQGKQLLQAARTYLPRSLDPDVEAISKVTNRAFGGAIRGQLIESTIYAVLIFAAMTLFAHLVPGSSQLGGFAAISGILAGLLLIIPVIGCYLSLALLLVIGALALQNGPHLIALFVIVWLIEIVVTDFLGPRVMSDAVGVNTLLSFGALLIGGKLGGILGAFYALPLLAVALAVLERVYLHLTNRAPAVDGQEQTPADQHYDPAGAAASPERREGSRTNSPARQHSVLASLRSLRRG
jgi:predicted PurR-regulated permease PerM